MAENHRACASCGTANDEDARFCEGCGAALGRTCGTCGVEANATARFCRACGAPLDDRVAPTADSTAAGPSRKTVTVMFADLAGSTTFEEQVDAETAREVMSRYHDLLRSTAEHNRAGVTKYIGDGFMAVWGVPEIGPDDAGRAVDAAVELQERFVDFAARVSETQGVELALRVAVNTGEVVVGAGDADLVGDALNVAARLEAECPRGHVVVGEETWRSTRGGHRYESLGQVQVKGRTAPVVVYQWLGRQSETTDAAPFVGRADEVRRLRSALNAAVAAQAARLVTVIGDPGVGKSRLAAEFTGTQRDARVVEARCDVEVTVALAPIVEVLRARDLNADVPVGVPERERILRDLTGLTAGVPGSVEETFWALRRYVEMLARDGPLIIVADDIQWADTLLLDFVEHLVEWVQEVPVLVLALARPELREVRPDLVAVSRWVSEAVHLGGLDPGATAELAASVLGAAELPDELLRRLPSSTGGNPLFVRELVGMLVHDGVLVAEPTGWRLTIDVDAIAIPPTIQALLASRLERLNAADRRVLEIASVVGTDFSLGVVCALAERGSPEVKRSLDRLRRLDLAQPSGAYLGDEPVWRFHHVLIRDVAYRRLLKSDRANLHERLADWLEAGGASVAFDPDEMIARHLEAAHAYRRELGTVDEHTGELALRSARRYLASARRALDRDELISAGTQAARGAALAAADRAVHAELLLVGCEAFLSAGDVAAGAPLVDDLDRVAGDALAPWATCYRCQFDVYTDPERLLDVDARLQSAIDEFGRRKDPAGLAKAHRVRAGARGRLGRIGDCEVDLFEALIAARQGGDHRQITAALGAAPSAALWGPSPVPKAGGRCLDVVRMQRMTTAAPSLEATSLRCLAVLELLRGRPDKARTMLAEARQIVADLGLRHGLMETELFAGIIESMVGDEVAAEPHFRTAMEGLDALGVGADAGQAAALLARSVLAQGRIDEADRYAAESERIAGHNLKTAIAWRAVRAEILAAQGRNDEAAAMARDAVAVAVETDLVLDHADACLTLSRVLTVAGNAKGAKDARDEANKLYGAKEVATTIRPATEPVVSAVLIPAPAEPGPTTSRLAVKSRASAKVDALWRKYQAHNVSGAIADFASERFVYDDRRRLSGNAIIGLDAMEAASERALEQYPQSEWRTLAVRGERLDLRSIRMWDDAGNEATTLNVFELDDHGRVEYWRRFDEDDFDGAYRELDRRYYAGEGAAFAEAGATVTEWTLALNRADFDTLFDELTAPDLCVKNRSRSAFPDRSATEYRTTLEELAAMVISARSWNSALCWLSPNCCVTRGEREAIGQDDEHYAWSFVLVVEVRGGQVASMCQFESDDEDAAFAYAEERVGQTTSRLAVTNRSCEFLPEFHRAIRAHDVDGSLSAYSDQFVYDDHRRLSGDPIIGLTAMRAAIERIFDQYTQFEIRVLAVRGQRLHLLWTRWSDDNGNETATLYVNETGDDGRVSYHAHFDEDDFEGTYRELDRRYYAGEGAAFAGEGALATDWMIAHNQGDFDRAFGELSAPGLRLQNRSSSAFPERSIEEFRASSEELRAMVTSAQMWHSVVCCLSPAVSVCRTQREAVGLDGEQYAWAWIYVGEAHDGRLTSLCQFDLEDEAAAFAYAEERVRATTSRLTVSNRASEILGTLVLALQAPDPDLDSYLAGHSDRYVYDDRRRLGGDPIEGLAAFRTACERFLEQHQHFEWRTLAVRGARLGLGWSRWSDDAGNETQYLAVFEVDDDGQITHHIRFDGDNFEGAYCELDHRYYGGEGAAFAVNGHVLTKLMAAMDQVDVEAARNLTQPEFRWLATPSALTSSNQSVDVDDLFRYLQERARQVASVRHVVPTIRWLSPDCLIGIGDARAVGLDSEDYEWMRLYVCEYRDGLLASVRQFELDDEEAAFAYAESLVAPRLSLDPPIGCRCGVDFGCATWGRGVPLGGRG
jgi:class 3 adenylate cyclase